MQKKKYLENIDPFNDVFFKSCEYCSLFSIVKYYKKEIFPIIFNEAYYFSYDRKDNALHFKTRYLENFESLLTEKVGLHISKFEASGNLVDDVMKSIDQGKPVIIYVDRFYQSMVPMFYNKMHGYHALLIYGYDHDTEDFHVIEDNCHNIVPFGKYKMPYSDTIEAYNGYLNNYHKKLALPSYYEYTPSDLLDNDSADIDKCRTEYINGINNMEEILFQSLDCIKSWQLHFSNLIHTGAVLSDIDRCETTSWWIIQYKNTEKYKMQLLFGDRFEQAQQLQQIIEEWNVIRNNLRMIQFKRKKIDEFAAYVVSKLDEIYEKEYVYLKDFFGSLKNTIYMSGVLTGE
jgi:uncharacterized protein YvpB